MRDPQRSGVRDTDVAGARMLGVLADILDDAVDPSRLSTDRLAYAATVAIRRLRAWGIHPGQRDADGLPVPPPHDDNCPECEHGGPRQGEHRNTATTASHGERRPSDPDRCRQCTRRQCDTRECRCPCHPDNYSRSLFGGAR